MIMCKLAILVSALAAGQAIQSANLLSCYHQARTPLTAGHAIQSANMLSCYHQARTPLAGQAIQSARVLALEEISRDIPPRTVTLDDSGTTLRIAVGDRLLIRLGSDLDWTLETYDAAILAEVPSRSLDKGVQALLQAKQRGTTQLSLIGDPPCAKSRPPCNAPSRQFRVTVVVE